MALHEAAQGVACFVAFTVAGIAVLLWYDMRKEVRHAQKQTNQSTAREEK
jgi:hypothetical protein